MSKKKKIIISVIAAVLIIAVIVSAVVIAMTKGKNAAKASGVYANKVADILIPNITLKTFNTHK